MNTPTVCRASHDTAESEPCPAAADDREVVHPADLHAWAAGDLSLMAAVRLLDDSRLLDHEWTGRFLKTNSIGGQWYLDFFGMKRALVRGPLSGGEKALAGAAASLAAGLKIDLGEALLALDIDSIGHLVVAIGVIARGGTGPQGPIRPTLVQSLAVGA